MVVYGGLYCFDANLKICDLLCDLLTTSDATRMWLGLLGLAVKTKA
jgi:hypothetical protein